MHDLSTPQRTAGSSVDELERLRAEHSATVQTLQAAVRDTSRLARLFAILNEAGPLDRVLDRVLATLSELFLADVVVLLESTGDGGFSPLATIGLPAGMERRVAFSSEMSYTTSALRTRQPLAATGARVDPKVDAYLRELGVESAVWLPVAGDESTCRGVLVLGRCQALPFIQSDIDLLMAMAYRIGVLVERAHAEEERRNLENRLRQAEKTESLGRMASAIAHHFNNMLGAVVSSLDLALDELSDKNQTVLEDLEIARESALRAAKTSELMLAYLGQSVRSRETVDLTEVLREALPELQASVPAGVKLTFDLRDSGLIVLVSSHQIGQLLTNLITNAWEAMNAMPGEIQVSVRAVSGARVPKTYLPADWTPRAASYVCLEVRDTGCGMTADTVGKIFDPFFTTKFVGRGLGLPVVLGTVRAYDGIVSVESVIGKGSTFRVFLPHAPLSLLESRTPTPSGTAGLQAKPSLILLAEDEERLLRNTQRMLVRLGYEVMAASDGVVAVERFRQRAGDVRVAVLDIAMPRMDGWATLAAIRALRPNLPVILVSGYNQVDVLRGQPPQHGLSFLHKPYSLVDLCKLVAKALATTEDSAQATPPR